MAPDHENSPAQQDAVGIAHDVRNAVHTVTGALWVIEKQLPSATPKVRAELERARRALRHIEDLLSNLVDWSALDSGALVLNRKPVPIADLLTNATALWVGQAGAKEILVADSVTPRDLTVYVDPLRLERVLTNLVGNAVKFTPRGGTVILTAHQLNAQFVNITVSDTGPGIDPAHAARIFDRHWGSPGSSGAGLGLSIAKEIIVAHGGRITVRNATDGGGAIFTIELPRPPPLSAQEEPPGTDVLTDNPE